MNLPEHAATPPAPPAPAENTDHAASTSSNALGRWAFAHRDAFSQQSPLAWYGLRNVLVNMVSIAGLMAVIVPLRKAMGHGAQWAESRGYKILSEELSRNMWQNALGVGASFATFRTLYKAQQRSYDDLFVRPKSAGEASDAAQALPGKFLSNLWQIATVELPTTMLGAFALVGIRTGIAGATANPKHPVFNKDAIRDIAGCAIFAYPAFFEICEHLQRAYQLKRGYQDPYHNEHINKDKQSMGEFFARQLPAVSAGIIPYIAFNTWGYSKTGRQLSFNTSQRAAGIRTIDSFWSAYKKEIPYQFFWMYTLGRDLYYDAFDKLTGRSNKPGSHSASNAPAQPGSTVASVSDHALLAQAPQHVVSA